MQPSIVLKRMEDHKNAHLFWKEVGIFDACCIHVDAHLDVTNFKAPSCLEEPGDDPLLNCANFLTYSIGEGRVTQLVWVIPPHILPWDSPPECFKQAFLDWVRDEFQRWNRLTVSEYDSIESFDQAGTIVTGRLNGCQFFVCQSVDFSNLEGVVSAVVQSGRPLLVDLDIDYFCAPDPANSQSDLIWQKPWDLFEELSLLKRQVSAWTVADSISGGYTPVEYRFLGDLCELCCADEIERAQDFFLNWSSGQMAAPESPPWFQAACLMRDLQAKNEPRPWTVLEERFPDFRDRPIDLAARYFQRRDIRLAEFWSEKLTGATAADSLYFQSLLAVRRGRYELAVQRLEEMLQLSGSSALDSNTASHVHDLVGRFALELGPDYYPMVAFHYQSCLDIDRRDCTALRGLAEARVGLGQVEEATRHLRRIITLEPDMMATELAIQRLATLYHQTGQLSLEENLRHRYPRALQSTSRQGKFLS